jgi:hypothetical protein
MAFNIIIQDFAAFSIMIHNIAAFSVITHSILKLSIPHLNLDFVRKHLR